LTALENAYVGLDQVWGRARIELHERLIGAATMATRFGILENFLLSRPWSSARRHPGVAAVLAAFEDNPSIRMADIRDLVGISTKPLIALFRAEVGMSPNAYARIRPFQAALRLLGAGSMGRSNAANGRVDSSARAPRPLGQALPKSNATPWPRRFSACRTTQGCPRSE
jgi:AraC-like DNA-binding protein